MHKTVVINVVGLSPALIGQYTPFLSGLSMPIRRIEPACPAVTTTAQSCYVTGKWPQDHGIVGNGWYDAVDCEIKFWKQANPLVQAEKIWERAKKVDSSFTFSNMFWWYNMYSSADYSVTPRPQYHANGLKLPDCYSHPPELRDHLQAKLGTFPLFNFWGPNANIVSTQWIAEATLEVDRLYDPTLTLVYLPHLDYCQQKVGPFPDLIAQELGEVDEVVAKLYRHYEDQGARVLILSEYGIQPVTRWVDLNLRFREKGWLRVREESGRELLDAGASEVFAVVDHQIAHVHVKDSSRLAEVKAYLAALPGIDQVWTKAEQGTLAHARSGDLVCLSAPDAWFTYYYWLDKAKEPDFAHTVDIHRKPGYDPVEMFMDPANPFIKLRAGFQLLKKKLGFRYLMDVIPTDPALVKGSHGTPFGEEKYHPVLFSPRETSATLPAVAVYDEIWAALTTDQWS